METRGQPFRGLWDELTASAFPPRLRGREVGGVEMVLLDADVAGCVESWLGSPQPLGGQRRERLEQCRAELDHVLPLLSDPAERLTAHSSAA